MVELITHYVEDALEPETAARVSAHLAGCEGCTVYLDQMRVTASAVRDVELPGLPDEACAELLVAFRDWSTPR